MRFQIQSYEFGLVVECSASPPWYIVDTYGIPYGPFALLLGEFAYSL